MADIFISYAREDKERVRPIVKELEKLGWSLFWDTKIQPGDNWPIEITEALKSSRCVVVLWSLASVDFKIHHWIRAEAEYGRKKGILVPLLLDDVEIPIEFSHLQAADLSDWAENMHDHEFQKLVNAIASIISSRPSVTDIASYPVATPSLKQESLDPEIEKWRQQRRFSKRYQKQPVIAVAVIVVLILFVVGIMSFKQENLSDVQAPITLSLPVSSDAEAVKTKLNANDSLLLRRVEEARMTVEKKGADASQKIGILKVKQNAEMVRQKAEDARLKAEKEAVTTQEVVKQNANLESKNAFKKAENPQLTVEKEAASSKIKTLKIGDKYGGGIVFDVDGTGHVLIAAKADLPGGAIYTWDTAKIASQKLEENGYSDWYLPSKEELNKLYLTKSVVGDFAESKVNYWSSTDGGGDMAWHQYLKNGYQYRNPKDSHWRVRPIRAF